MQYKISCTDKAIKCSDQTSFLVIPECCKDLGCIYKCPFKYSLMLLSENFFAPLYLKIVNVLFPARRNLWQDKLCYALE